MVLSSPDYRGVAGPEASMLGTYQRCCQSAFTGRISTRLTKEDVPAH
jgi:hypothetical protein